MSIYNFKSGLKIEEGKRFHAEHFRGSIGSEIRTLPPEAQGFLDGSLRAPEDMVGFFVLHRWQGMVKELKLSILKETHLCGIDDSL